MQNQMHRLCQCSQQLYVETADEIVWQMTEMRGIHASFRATLLLVCGTEHLVAIMYKYSDRKNTKLMLQIVVVGGGGDLALQVLFSTQSVSLRNFLFLLFCNCYHFSKLFAPLQRSICKKRWGATCVTRDMARWRQMLNVVSHAQLYKIVYSV